MIVSNYENQIKKLKEDLQNSQASTQDHSALVSEWEKQKQQLNFVIINRDAEIARLSGKEFKSKLR